MMQKIKQHQEESWVHLFRMRALSLMKKASKQERRKTEKERKTLQKPAGNSLFLSKHIADTDLSRSQHLLPTCRVSPRHAERLLRTQTREHQELTWHVGHKWSLTASESTSELNRKETCSFDAKTVYFDLQANSQIFSAERSLFQHGKWKKKPDSWPHMVVTTKANGGVCIWQSWKTEAHWHYGIGLWLFYIIRNCLFHLDGCLVSVDSGAPY